MNHPTEFLHFCGIETRYHGPTNNSGSRISARYLEHKSGDPIVWISYGDADSPIENHSLAAKKFADKANAKGAEHGLRAYPLAKFASSTPRGYVFFLDWTVDKSES